MLVLLQLSGKRSNPAGPSKVPLRGIYSVVYPPWRIRQRNVEGKAPWRVLDMTNLPCSPSDPSRNDVWKVERVSTFSLGVLVRGHGIHNYYILSFLNWYTNESVWSLLSIFYPDLLEDLEIKIKMSFCEYNKLLCYSCRSSQQYFRFAFLFLLLFSLTTLTAARCCCFIFFAI